MACAQAVHAAGESAPTTIKPGTYAVVLAASSKQLEELEQRLTIENIVFASIRENDPPYCGELLAKGIAPRPKSELRRFVSSLPLLR